MSSFIDQCLKGHALLSEIDDYVDSWHAGNYGVELHEYLGMKKSEYALWLNQPSILALIVTARKEGRDVVSLIEESQAWALAARSGGPDNAAALARWLKEEDLWD